MPTYFLNIGAEEDVAFNTLSPLTVRMVSLIPETHDYLFQFLDADLYKAETPLAEYLSCLDHDREPRPQSLYTALSMPRSTSAWTNCISIPVLPSLHSFVKQSTQPPTWMIATV